MDPKTPETDNWSVADIAAMLTGRDERNASMPSYTELPVELSPGFHPGEGEYVIDPDYMEILGISDPADLVRRKSDISR
jgi:hypothetical protein